MPLSQLLQESYNKLKQAQDENLMITPEPVRDAISHTLGTVKTVIFVLKHREELGG